MSRRMVVEDHSETEDESSKDGGEEEEEEEYEVQNLRDRIKSSRGSQFNLIKNELGLGDGSSTWRRRLGHQSLIDGVRGLSKGFVIHPANWWYRVWMKFILLWAVYSSFFTPFEFGFFRGLGDRFFILDVVGQVAFLVDIVLQFFIAYRDIHTYRMVYKRNRIALRYLKSSFIIDLLGCMPWDNIYKACGRREEVRYLLWIRLCRVCKVTRFFHDLEKDIRINYLFTRIIKLIVVELYSTHTAACIFYYLVIKLHEEFLFPGEVIMEPGKVVDQLYFVCHGVLEEVGIGEDGTEETLELLEPNSSFGEISILCKIPQLYTVRVCELCRLLRIDKQSFTSILGIYFYDGRKILNKLLEGKAPRMKQLESNITFHIGKQEAEFALKFSSAAYHGDLFQLKGLIRPGADPNKTDYDGRSPLHLAALKGHEDITLFLIREGVDINIKDNFGNTPLLEAIKNGNDRVSSLLIQQGASLNIDNAGCFICTSIARGDADLLKRLLANGIDPNSKDYDHRTPLHVAASEGLYIMAKLLLEAGASVFSKDRWGNTPLGEGRMCGNKNLIKLLEEAKAAQLTEFPYCAQAITDKMHPKKCTVYSFHPWESREGRRPGIVLWVPSTIGELIRTAGKQLEFSSSGSDIILTEDAGKILDVNLINDGQRLYLVSETHFT
ncbi:potassium channel SKOR-like [Pyrus communis]|uniref:potassium channel SKOR-like n=1 Tax=Pyrus communis TaxID=23211 RepID=UPI0035C1349F